MSTMQRVVFVVAIVVAAGLADAARAATAPVGVLTYHNDNFRTGWYPAETRLTTANVNPTQFGLKFSVKLSGVAFAQPLYVPQRWVGGRRHDLIIVATENAVVYGIDAQTGAILWTHGFARPPRIRASHGCHCSQAAPQGLTGTPTIDVARDSIYVVVRTDETVSGETVTRYRLHALLTENGNDRLAPRIITLSAPVSGGTVELSPTWNLQRPGLAEANGLVYVAFGSQGDREPATTTGWLAAFDAATLAPAGAVPTGATLAGGAPQNQRIVGGGYGPVRLASVWMSGAAPAIDAGGNLYVQTGNGAFDAHRDWGQSLLKITPTLSAVSDFFTPSTYQYDNDHDQDLGSAGVVLLPQAAGTYQVAVGGGKRGITYLLDQQHLGGVQPPGDPNVLFAATTNDGLWGTPASYIGADAQTYVVVPGSGPMTLWRVTTASPPALVKVGQTPDEFGHGDGGGTIPVISSNGQTPGTAIVWAYSRSAGASEIMLRAYDLTNLSHELLDIAFTRWTGPASLISPTVANGMVYAAGPDILNAYGLI